MTKHFHILERSVKTHREQVAFDQSEIGPRNRFLEKGPLAGAEIVYADDDIVASQ
jgi:hypothetical protein